MKIKSFTSINLHFVSAGSWLFIGQVLSTIGAFASTVVIANVLNSHDLGTYRYLIGLGAILGVFTLTGMSSAIIQASAKGIKEYLLIGTKIQFKWDWIIYLIGFLVASYYLIQGNHVLGLGVLILTTLLPTTNTLQNIFSFLEGQGQYRLSVLLSSSKVVVLSVSLIAVLLLTKNVLWTLLTYFLVQFLFNLFVFYYYKPRVACEVYTPDQFATYLVYSKHTSIRNAISTFASKLDSIILFQNIGAVELAVYSIANTFPEQIKGQYKNIGRMLIPKYVNYDPKDIRKNLWKNTTRLLILSIFLSLMYIVTAPILFKLFFPDYIDAIFYSQLAALSFPAAISLIPTTALQAEMKDRELHLINNIGSIGSILITLILILSLSVIGAVVAKILSRYLFTVLAFYYYLQNPPRMN